MPYVFTKRTRAFTGIFIHEVNVWFDEYCLRYLFVSAMKNNRTSVIEQGGAHVFTGFSSTEKMSKENDTGIPV